MINTDIMNKFGYSEMYEWSELFKFDTNPFGKFVTFSDNEHGKIMLANHDDFIVGVTTINSICTSDDPDEWQGKYLSSEVGDRILKYVDKACANLSYDEKLEMPLVTTHNYKELSPIVNTEFDETQKYEKRSNRKEWIRVNLLGKCIVFDNGQCQPNMWCTVGNKGIAVPAKFNNDKMFYVIDRISENTILIFYK